MNNRYDKKNILDRIKNLSKIGTWDLDIPSGLLTCCNIIRNIYEIKDKNKIINFDYFLSHIHPDDIDRINKILEDTVKLKKTHDYTTRIITDNGKIKYVSVICELSFDKRGLPVKSNGIMQDITIQKESENRIMNDFTRFQTVMDAMDAAVYVADMSSYELLFSNKKFNNDFGNKIGEKCYSVIQKGKSEKCEFCTNHLLVDKKGVPKKPHTWEFQNKTTKRWYQLRDQAIKWSDGKLVRLEIAIDITEQKKSDKKIKEEKEFSNKIIMTSSAIIVGLDKNHKIRLFNKGAETITGYKKGEVVGKDWFKIFFPKNIYDEMNIVWKDSWRSTSSCYTNPIKTKNNREKIISWQTTGLYEDENIDNHLLLSIGI